MLGGRHFAHKIAKRARRKEARKASRAAGASATATPSSLPSHYTSNNNNSGSSGSGSRAARKATTSAKTTKKTGSTLKGSVVVYDGGASRDTGNERAAAATSRAGSSSSSGGNNKAAGASSAAQRRRVLRQRSDEDLLDHFRTRLSASTFRLLNEQIYNSPTPLVRRLLGDAATFADYHNGYAQQLAQWPVQPSALVVQCLLGDKRGRFFGNKAKRLPGHIPRGWVVADMGCGNAHIAASLVPLGYTVHSFDLCVLDDDKSGNTSGSSSNSSNTTAATMSNARSYVTVASTTDVPLPSASVDVCVFALSLMATDYVDSLYEAFRILKPRRLLKIVEVRSRLPHPRRFADLVCGIGFTLEYTDVVGEYFVAYDFLKRDDVAEAQRNLCCDPNAVLVPSLYKKR